MRCFSRYRLQSCRLSSWITKLGLLVFGVLFFTVALANTGSAQPALEAPIYPIWRLMDDNAKKQFLAGYLYGFREARSLGEIAVEFSKSKPQDLEEGLSSILQHYRLTSLAPDKLSPLLDEYLKSPERQQDSLRLAINRLQQLPNEK